MNSVEVGEIMAYLAAAWPKHELHPETVKIWIDQFKDVDFVDAQNAAKRCVAEDEWFPSVARLKSLCGVRHIRRPLGCGKCDQGFRLSDDGSVTFCTECRTALPKTEPSRTKELSSGMDSWKEWLDRSRNVLGERMEKS